MPCPCMKKLMKSKKYKKNLKKRGGKNKKSLKKCNGDLLYNKKNKKKYCVGLCPHAQGHVRLGNNKFICNRHGAEFTMEGEVLLGPAISPLYVREMK